MADTPDVGEGKPGPDKPRAEGIAWGSADCRLANCLDKDNILRRGRIRLGVGRRGGGKPPVVDWPNLAEPSASGQYR